MCPLITFVRPLALVRLWLRLFETTPQDLVQDGLYRKLAVAFHPVPFRAISLAQAAKALELKLNKVYKALSREATRGREDREGLWGSLSELSCRISEIRAIVE